jgi:hypothetical protein
MATARQKLAFRKLSEKVRDQKPVVMGRIMREVGYSKQTSLKPKKLTESAGWQQLLGRVDDFPLITQAFNIALAEDKRASLQAIDMLLKLKDRYPAGKLKVQEYQEELALLESK